MPRNAKCRRICQMPLHCKFSPDTPTQHSPVILSVEEYEAIRMMDHLGLNQEEAAVRMAVARTTFQRIYTQARQKLAIFLVEGRPLQIEGGSYALCSQNGCQGRGNGSGCASCHSEHRKEAES